MPPTFQTSTLSTPDTRSDSPFAIAYVLVPASTT